MNPTTPPLESLQGTWRLENSQKTLATPLPRFSQGQCRLILGTVLLILGLALLAGGGLLLYLKVHTITVASITCPVSPLAYSLFGCGALPITLMVGGIADYIRKQKDLKRRGNSYSIVSWNIGTQQDYSTMCFIKGEMKAGHTVEEAYGQLNTLNRPPTATSKELADRSKILRKAFSQFNNPDIICLQETLEMSKEALHAILPPGYSCFRPADNGCAIVWNSSRFSKTGHATLTHGKPSTLVLLLDQKTNTKICVGSAQLASSVSNQNKGETEQPEKELEKPFVEDEDDKQAEYDLNTMEGYEAALYVYAGDFNATTEHSVQLFDTISNRYEYTGNPDNTPTVRSTRSFQADRIYVKSRRGIRGTIYHTKLTRTELDQFNNRASNHIPIGACVAITKG